MVQIPEPKPVSQQEQATEAHQRALEELVQATVVARGIRDPRVIGALRRIPRHLFVSDSNRSAAYDDGPLPIGWGQTISQPYVVALMTEASIGDAPGKCLEIGTGSGYQTAILALLCREVFSIERIGELVELAERNMRAAGCRNERIHLRHGDGYCGWPEAAPFDLIVVTAAPNEVPALLLAQLAPLGRLVIPIGPQNGVQRLERWTRIAAGTTRASFAVETLLDVRFVPMLNQIRGSSQRA